VVWVDLRSSAGGSLQTARNAGNAMPEADIHVRHFKLANSLAEYTDAPTTLTTTRARRFVS
jgi:hypothetical protein